MATKATPRVKAGDFTGKQREAAQKEHAAEMTEKSKQLSMATANEAQAFDDNVHDARNPESPTIIDEIEDAGSVDMSQKASVIIRVNEDIDDMTYGYGQTYSMKAGGQYRVPKDVADHLETLQLIWH